MANAARKFGEYFGLVEPRLSEIDEPAEVVYEGPRVVSAPRVAPAQPEVIAEVTPIGSAKGYQQPVAKPTDLRRITTIHPRSYNDARAIGEAFRSGIPVIMNLSDMSDQEAKRLVDFSSGLIFGLHGGIERVTGKVFLLSPEHIEVIGEEEIESGESSGSHFYNQS